MTAFPPAYQTAFRKKKQPQHAERMERLYQTQPVKPAKPAIPMSQSGFKRVQYAAAAVMAVIAAAIQL
jgi:hypothetical protein